MFEAGIPDEMLAGLDTIDLAGIGILPGPMRKMLGVSHPFVASVRLRRAARRDPGLGAHRADDARPRRDDAEHAGRLPTSPRLDAYEQQLESIAGNEYWRDAEYVTANVNLWPRPTGAVHER